MRRLAAAAVLAAALTGAGRAAAATYYVSPSGSDSNSGASPAAAWQTIQRVNSASLSPGDTVLFQGGQTFTDTTLMPGSSGSSGTPITFSSYGTGRATISNANGAVWFSGKHYLTFDDLALTTGGSSTGIFAGSGGGASDHIVLDNSTISNSGGLGVISPNPGDSAWTISNNTFTNLGDSALILEGSDESVLGNTISNVGVNSAISYGKHGVYAKGPDMTIANNDISQVTGGQAVSIRFHGARVYGNTIHDTGAAFAFFDYDTSAAPQGTSYIYDNRAWNLTDYAFYYDGQLDPQGNAPTVDFVLASNTFAFSNASEAVNVSPSGSAHVTILNNIFTGTYGSGLRAASTTVERNDDWAGAGSNVPSNSGDTTVASGVSAPDFALPTGSQLVDAGVTSPLLAYTPSCDGTPLSYCGTAPDLGASESAAAAPAPSPAPSGGGSSSSGGGSSSGSGGSTSGGSTGGASSGGSSAPAPAPAPNPNPPAPAPVADTTPPVVSFATPQPSSLVGRAFSFAGAARDAGGIAEVDLLVDGKTACKDSTAPYYCGVTVKAGWHTLTVRARDRAGNTSSISERVRAVASTRRVAAEQTTAKTSATAKHSARTRAQARTPKRARR